MNQNDLSYNNFQELPENETFDLKQWLFRLIRLWPWIVLSLAACLTIAYLYLRYTEPVFKSQAAIMIKDEKKGAGLMDNSMMKELGIGGAGKLVENETEILKSFDLMREVVMQEKLYVQMLHRGNISDRTIFGKTQPLQLEIANPDSIYKTMKWELIQNKGVWMFKTAETQQAQNLQLGVWYKHDAIRFQFLPNFNFQIPSKNPDTDYYINLYPPNSVTQSLISKLEITPVSKMASVLKLAIEELNAEKATAILRSLIVNYNQQGLEDKNLVTANTMDFLSERLEVVERELKGVEGKVEQFKSRNQITNISSDAQQYLDLAKDIDQQRAVQQTQVNIINALEKELLLNQENDKLVPSTLGINEPSMMSLISRHNELVLQKQRIKEKAGPSNPLLIDLSNQVKDVRVTLIENVKNMRNALNIGLSDVSRKDAQLSGRIRNIPQLEKNLVQITRDQSVKEQLYFYLLQKREESAVSLASSITDSRTIEKARAIGQTKPKNKMVWAMGLLIGLILPIAGMAGIDFLDNKVGNKKEVEQKSKAALLGEIGYIKNLETPIPVLNEGRAVISEQFRSIRTAISYTGQGQKNKVILVSSHRPGEGKSFTSLNLAASYALLKEKVVILEFDLRKPRLSRNLGFRPQMGISTYLSGQASLKDLFLEIPGTKNSNLFLLPAGPIPPNPAELILGEKMVELMAELRKEFDHIIIDTPPFSVVTDATLLQQYADMSVIVLRQGFSFKDAFEDLNQRIIKYPQYPAYTVLNGVGKTNRYEYGYQSYGYGYGYGQRYGEGYFDDELNRTPFWKKLFGKA